MSRSIDVDLPPAAAGDLDVAEVYAQHGEHAWRCLHRLGVRAADLPDLLQEVFVVVHRRRREWDGRSMRAWLWGICVGLARNYHRRAFRRSERGLDEGSLTSAADDPERALERRRERERGARLLAALDPEKRAIFVMFEVEGMSGKEIAEQLEIPLGTVHSRLHAARRELERALREDA